MTARVRRLAGLLLCASAVAILVACGKRGNPIPPLQRIPGPPIDLTATRLDDEVYVRLTVPTANIDGRAPADVARVDVYAVTLDRDLQTLTNVDPEDLRKLATLVGSETVRRPAPPPPPVKEGMPPVPLPPPGPGVDQGASIVVHETLNEAMRTPVTVPDDRRPDEEAPVVDVPRPLVAPRAAAVPMRYYFAVAVSDRGRHGPHSGHVSVPLGATSGPPSAPAIEVQETAVTLRWTPPVDVRRGPPPPDPDLLPSRWLIPTAEPTTYDVYEVPANASAEEPLAPPTPLTPAPVAATAFTQENITLGKERCFYVRSVDIINGVHVRGPASPTACASFADTFAPGPPSDLVAVAVPGAINVIWEASSATDVARYVVLRGEAGGDTLTPLAEVEAGTLSYRDERVQGGTRYVYAIVAVDEAGNRSEESNRYEETAR